MCKGKRRKHVLKKMAFIYKKALGWAHDAMHLPTMVYLVTVRFQDESIPGGSQLMGRLVESKNYSRIDLFTDTIDRLYDRYVISLAELAQADLFELAQVILDDYKAEDDCPMPEPKIHKEEGSVIIVSYTEEQAARKAFRVGYRVIAGHDYSSKRDFRPRLPWKGLLEYQKQRG
jgi:hypothetical protein